VRVTQLTFGVDEGGAFRALLGHQRRHLAQPRCERAALIEEVFACWTVELVEVYHRVIEQTSSESMAQRRAFRVGPLGYELVDQRAQSEFRAAIAFKARGATRGAAGLPRTAMRNSKSSRAITTCWP
jgi:hypothetical protein